MSAGWDRARAVADAVLYEGYLLYPYRANSRKNQSRWQFGVLGPAGPPSAGIGEDDSLSAQLLVDPARDPSVSVVVRFLQLQRRGVERDARRRRFEPVDELVAGTQSWLSWDEAVERELSFGPFDMAELAAPQTLPIAVAGGHRHRDRRRRAAGAHPLRSARGELTLECRARRRTAAHQPRRCATPAAPVADKDDAIAVSLIGTHLIAEVTDGEFVSLLEPPRRRPTRVARCRQHRCFPVLAGPPGERDLVLVSPIILYDHPGDRRTERGRAVRLHGDRRDPHPAGDDDDRRGEGAGPRHRPAGRADHRPLRLDVTGGDAQPAWRAAQSARTRSGRPG